jgi:hypothetical protein
MKKIGELLLSLFGFKRELTTLRKYQFQMTDTEYEAAKNLYRERDELYIKYNYLSSEIIRRIHQDPKFSFIATIDEAMLENSYLKADIVCRTALVEQFIKRR